MFAKAIYDLFDLIMLLMLIKVLLTWFPNINWNNQPFKLLNACTEWVFAPFRRIIPPIGFLDISPIVAFIVLRLLQIVICQILIPRVAMMF